MPRVEQPATPPLPGTARVVIDSVDGPMDVYARSLQPTAAPTDQLSCRTPCAADLGVGAYDLYFSNLESDNSRGGRARVSLVEGVNVVREAPGQYKVPQMFQWPSFLLSIGGVGLIAAGAVVAQSDDVHADAPAVISIGAGAALIVAALVVHQYVAHQQAGATTHFVLSKPEGSP